MLEIERKFLVDNENAGIFIAANALPATRITQTYLEKTNDTELRIRKSVSNTGNVVYTRTKKIGKGLSREEFEKEISETEYLFLLPSSIGEVFKARYYFNDNKDCIDYYPLLDIATFEAEFPSEEEAIAFNPEDSYPGLTVRELVSDKLYSNLTLGKTQKHIALLKNIVNELQ